MSRQSCPVRVGLSLSFAVLGASAASAAEYCVTCAAPAAMYRCAIEGTPEGRGTDPSASLFCISELAKSGGHETCTVSKSAPFPCPGETRLLAIPAEGLPPGPTLGAPAPGADDAPPPDTEPKAAQPSKVPRTVEEFAGQTVDATKQGLKNAGKAVGDTAEKAGEAVGSAGSAVGNAAKKTWNCLTSLFSDC